MATAQQVASLYGVLDLDDKASAKLQQAEQNMSRTATAMGNVSTAAMNVGGAMTAGVTVPLLGVATAAARTAIRMESGFTDVLKTVDATDGQLVSLQDTLMAMATDLSVSPVASLEDAPALLMEIAAAAGQLGVGVEDIDEFTETVAMLSMTTNIAGEEGARALAQFTNVTGFPNAEIRRLGDVIADLGNNSATTENDILMLGQRIATLSSVGLAEDELLGFAAAISSAGISAELGGTNFVMAVNEMAVAAANGGPKLDTLAQTAGMTADEFAGLMESDPSAAIQGFVNGLGQLDTADQVATLDSLGLSGQEVQRVMRTLAGNTDLLGNSLQIANEAFQGNNALMNEATTRAGTTAGQLNTMMNNVTALGVAVGNVLLPPLNAFLPIATSMINRLSEVNPRYIQMALGLGLVAAAIGPVILAIGALLSPIGLATAAGVALTTAYMTNFGGFRDFIDGPFKTSMTNFFNFLTAFWNNLKTVVNEVTAAINTALTGITTAIDGVIARVQAVQDRISNFSMPEFNGPQLRNPFRRGNAGGGVIPAGETRLVGEQGPELIQPTDSSRVTSSGETMGMMGGGITVNMGGITIGAGATEADYQTFEQRFMETLRSVQ